MKDIKIIDVEKISEAQLTQTYIDYEYIELDLNTPRTNQEIILRGTFFQIVDIPDFETPILLNIKFNHIDNRPIPLKEKEQFELVFNKIFFTNQSYNGKIKFFIGKNVIFTPYSKLDIKPFRELFGSLEQTIRLIENFLTMDEVLSDLKNAFLGLSAHIQNLEQHLTIDEKIVDVKDSVNNAKNEISTLLNTLNALISAGNNQGQQNFDALIISINNLHNTLSTITNDDYLNVIRQKIIHLVDTLTPNFASDINIIKNVVNQINTDLNSLKQLSENYFPLIHTAINNLMAPLTSIDTKITNLDYNKSTKNVNFITTTINNNSVYNLMSAIKNHILSNTNYKKLTDVIIENNSDYDAFIGNTNITDNLGISLKSKMIISLGDTLKIFQHDINEFSPELYIKNVSGFSVNIKILLFVE